VNLKKWVRTLQGASLALCLVSPIAPACAQSYPNKSVRVLVPFGAGTSNNIVRFFAERMSAALGQPFVVENRAGAAGTLGLDQGLKAQADGYTITQISNTNTVAAKYMFKRLPFDPSKDMTPIGSIYEIPTVVIASAKGPLNTFPEFLAYARAHRGELSYAYSHATGAVTGESVKLAGGIQMTAVPYKDGGQAVVETIGGIVPILCTDIAIVLPHIKAGTLRALAVTSAKRASVLPNVPALREVLPNPLEFVGWGGFVVPAGTPRPIVDKLNETLNKILATDEAIKFLREQGAEPLVLSPTEFAKYIRDQEPLWGRSLVSAGIQPE